MYQEYYSVLFHSFTLFLSMLLFCGCEKSQKTKWLTKDKQMVENKCVNDLKNAFKDNPDIKYLQINPQEITAICKCFVKKAEQDFLPHKYTQTEVTNLNKGCFTQEIFGEKGKWKPKFKKNYTQLVKDKMEIKGEPTTEEQILLECFISKYEQEMDIFRLADMEYVETQTKELMENCVKELGE